MMPAVEAMVKVLEDEGVEVIFGIPEAGILPFYNAMRKSKRIKHYMSTMKRAPHLLLIAMQSLREDGRHPRWKMPAFALLIIC